MNGMKHLQFLTQVAQGVGERGRETLVKDNVKCSLAFDIQYVYNSSPGRFLSNKGTW